MQRVAHASPSGSPVNDTTAVLGSRISCRPLKGFGAFEEILRSGRRVTSGPLSLTAESKQPSIDSAAPILVGVTIAKRIAPRAVMRNRVKRLLRESARQQVSVRTHELHELGIGRLIFIWRQAPSSPMKLRLADVAPHMTEALDKLLRQASLNPGGPV